MDLIMEIVGWIGAAEVLLAYYLISTDKVKNSSLGYQLLHLTGGLVLTFVTLYKETYPSTFVNVIWIGVAVFAIWKYKLKAKS
jgi:hypothetical protein